MHACVHLLGSWHAVLCWWASRGQGARNNATLTAPPSQHTSLTSARAQVHPPKISFRDFETVLLRARPTVSTKDLAIYENFTSEFGEEG